MRLFVRLVQLAIALSLVGLAIYFRTPLLASIRSWVFAAIVVGSVGILVITLVADKTHQLQPLKLLVIAIASLSLFMAVGRELQFQSVKFQVLRAKPAQLEKLGHHFVVGYRNYKEVQQLVSQRAIAGIFLTTRNIRNKTKPEIQQEIRSLQAIRAQQGLPPLWVSSDQEGGLVSRLSPPLTQLPLLSEVMAANPTPEQQQAQVLSYAQTHAQELAELGVNLNFAPVVDLNKGIINPRDKFSRIYQRAIAADPQVVTQVALQYCQTLEAAGVKCTLKHFPGLGGVETDTHLEEADLSTPIAQLREMDWLPFREVMRRSQAATMLSHAKLTAIDPHHPVSFSQLVIQQIIRGQWQYQGVLVTDDFSMGAVYNSADGLTQATIKALNSGVDLVLISYDTDLYYEAMDALLKADQQDELDQTLLANSRQRLQQQAIALAQST